MSRIDKQSTGLAAPDRNHGERRRGFRRGSQGWRGFIIGLGRHGAVAAITAAAVVASLLITGFVMALSPGVPSATELLVISGLIPLIVAPLVTRSMVSVLYDLEQTRIELHQLATRDGLTHAYNRRFFMDRLSVESERARRERQPLSVMMIDVDHFKAINDQHGHAAGDVVLRQLARTLSDSVRPYDLVARYGGEEFVALLPGAALSDAAAVAERVRAAVARMQVVVVGTQPLSVTASVGVSDFGTDELQAAAMLERADQAMYRAKQGGRNACVCAPSQVPMMGQPNSTRANTAASTFPPQSVTPTFSL